MSAADYSDREQLAQWPKRAPLQWSAPVAVVDLETTDLDAEVGSITEIAVIRCDEAFDELDRVHIRVDVPRGAYASDWSRANTAWGTTPRSAWMQTSKPILSALAVAGRMFDGCALVGSGILFDVSYLAKAYEMMPDDHPGRDWILGGDWSRSSLDTRMLASPLRAQGKIKSRSLKSLCDHLRIPLKRHHDAMCDAEAALAVARRLLHDLR